MNQLSSSDITLIRGQLRSKLDKLHIGSWPAPKFEANFSIDVSVLEKVLDDEIGYYNKNAKEFDARSIEYIYRFRHGRLPLRLEDALAVMVTTNGDLAKVAFEHGRQHESSQEVSPVITGYALANIAWLKEPMGAPDLPAREVMSVCFAAMEPSGEMWHSYLNEIDRLQRNGTITPDEHRVLRDSVKARDELMNLTMGAEAALTEETVPQVLERVKQDLTAEKDAEIRGEHDAHQRTEEERAEAVSRHRKQQEKIFWRTKSVAQVFSWALFFILAALLVAGGILASPIASDITFGSRILSACAMILLGLAISWGLLNWVFGISLRELRKAFQKWGHRILLKWFSTEDGSRNE
ncbi:MAG: hypothetical protein HOJ57_17285 [Lentisphaerae bacterium]|jgi:hypothetical protein|nr:hypothetical protein [Lentisphaerota bacterium]